MLQYTQPWKVWKQTQYNISNSGKYGNKDDTIYPTVVSMETNMIQYIQQW